MEEKKTDEKEPGVGTQEETGMTDEGIVVEYDPRWPGLFEEEPAAFRSAVEEFLS